jgi:lipopolysaccharide export system permease protein
MGALGKIDPLIAIWVPFALVTGLVFWMFWTLAHKPGGQPIGALERVFAKIGKQIQRLLDLGGRSRRAKLAEAAWA